MTDAIRPAASPPDPRVRVLQAMAGAEVGGAEAFFVRLSKALRAADVEQRVVIRRHLDRAGVLRRTGVPTREVAFGGAFDFPRGVISPTRSRPSSPMLCSPG